MLDCDQDKIKELFFSKFQAEEKNNKEKIEELNSKLNLILGDYGEVSKSSKREKEKFELLEDCSEAEDYKREFFYKMRKKAFHKNIRKCIEKEAYNDWDFLIALSSMLVHSLIEVKKEKNKKVINYLDILEQVDLIKGVLNNYYNEEELKEFSEVKLKDYFFINEKGD